MSNDLIANIEQAELELHSLMAGLNKFKVEYDLLGEEHAKVMAAVVKHHSQKFDDLCWMDDNELYEACGLPPRDRTVGDPEQMLENCRRFIYKRCEGGGNWKSYVQLEKELREAECKIDEDQNTKTILSNQLTAARKDLQSLSAERDALLAENKRLAACVKTGTP